VRTTDSDHDSPIFPNLAANLVPDGPNQLWVADLSYVAIAVGFVYVAVTLDAWSRRAVGYAICGGLILVSRWLHSEPQWKHAGRHQDVSIIRIAAAGMLLISIGRHWMNLVCGVRWADAAIDMTRTTFHTAPPR
jgi:hypothetical protein